MKNIPDSLGSSAGSSISNMSNISNISELSELSLLNIGEFNRRAPAAPAVDFREKSGAETDRKAKGGREDAVKAEAERAERTDQTDQTDRIGRAEWVERARRERPGIVREYLADRKYYIFALSAVYIFGVILGAVILSNLERAEIINLSLIVDGYFADFPAAGMAARILGNIAVNLAFVFGAYLCGVTIFAPLVCAGFSLYKGLSAGFVIGVYVLGGGSNFHMAAAAAGFALNLLVMMFFVVVCAEAMSFSSFLFKSDESFKSVLSFKNAGVYSSRFIILSVLIALAAVVQTIIMPMVYLINN